MQTRAAGHILYCIVYHIILFLGLLIIQTLSSNRQSPRPIVVLNSVVRMKSEIGKGIFVNMKK